MTYLDFRKLEKFDNLFLNAWSFYLRVNSHPVHPGEGCIVVVVVPVMVVSERVARGTGGHHTPSSTTSQTPTTVALTPRCGNAGATAIRI